MVSIKSSVSLKRPLAEVFQFISDNQRNATQWVAGLIEARVTNHVVGVGRAWVDTMQLLGRRVEVPSEVTEYEPNRVIGFKSTSGPIPVAGSFSFEPDGEGTKLTYSLQGEPGGFFKLAEPLVARSMQRQWDTNLANLKDVLEQEATG
jgi:uncharacterized protein YndB with AHSA1/START domain